MISHTQKCCLVLRRVIYYTKYFGTSYKYTKYTAAVHGSHHAVAGMRVLLHEMCFRRREHKQKERTGVHRVVGDFRAVDEDFGVGKGEEFLGGGGMR